MEFQVYTASVSRRFRLETRCRRLANTRRLGGVRPHLLSFQFLCFCCSLLFVGFFRFCTSLYLCNISSPVIYPHLLVWRTFGGPCIWKGNKVSGVYDLCLDIPMRESLKVKRGGPWPVAMRDGERQGRNPQFYNR